MRNPSMQDNQGRPTTAWINNITYCGGANGGLAQCNTSVIDTIANITMCAPGAVCHSYTDSPLTPQFEHWRVIRAGGRGPEVSSAACWLGGDWGVCVFEAPAELLTRGAI